MCPSSSDVKDAWSRLQPLVGDRPSPRFFNAEPVLDAERRGMPVLDGLLGRVLETPPMQERSDLTLQICAAIADRMVAAEVQSRCHNLHTALFLMLDSAGIPSVMVWGSVHAETNDPQGSFALNAQLPPEGENHRPGILGLITPEFSVIDLALAHQGEVGTLRVRQRGDPFDRAHREPKERSHPKGVVSGPTGIAYQRRCLHRRDEVLRCLGLVGVFGRRVHGPLSPRCSCGS